MIIGRQKDDMIDAIVHDVFKHSGPFGAITTDPGLRAIPRKNRPKGAHVVDGRRDGDDLPGHALRLGIVQYALQPAKLCFAEHCPPWSVGTRSAVAASARWRHLNVAIGTIIDIDEDDVRAPALREI